MKASPTIQGNKSPKIGYHLYGSKKGLTKTVVTLLMVLGSVSGLGIMAYILL